MLQIALQAGKNYWASGWHALLFALALIYILVCVRERKVQKTFWWYSGLFMAIFICPITINIIISFIGELVYWRMLWLLPTSVITAFAFTHLYEKIHKKWLKMMVILTMILAVVFGGAWVYTNIEFRTAPNWHKVSVAVPGVCEAIQNDANEYGFEPRAAVVNSLLSEVRQYDAKIKMIYGRNAMRGAVMTTHRTIVYDQLQREIPEYKRLARAMKKLDCNYLVWTGLEETLVGFEENGFRLVGQVDRYKIFSVDIK